MTTWGELHLGGRVCLWTCEGEPLVELSASVMFALRCNSLPPNEGLALDERSSLVCVPPSGDSRAFKCSPKFLAVEMCFEIFSSSNPQFSALIRWLIFRLCFPPLQPEILRTFFDCSEHLELSHTFVSLGRVRPGDSERIVGARKDCCSVRCSFPVARGLRWTVLRSWLAPGLVPHEVLSSRLSSFSSRCSASPPFFQRSVSLRRALQTFP